MVFSRPTLRISSKRIWKSSSALPWMSSARRERGTMEGLRPAVEGTSTTSSSSMRLASAQPYFFFTISASRMPVLSPTARSLVKCSPPMGITWVCQMAPFSKTAMPVVPWPMFTRATPISFSSGVSTEQESAMRLSTGSATVMPHRFTTVLRFCRQVMVPVMMWTFTSSRLPVMASGWVMPSWLSTMYSWGKVWKICWSAGKEMVRDPSRTRWMSSRPMMRSRLVTATTPRLLKPRTWHPPTLT